MELILGASVSDDFSFATLESGQVVPLIDIGCREMKFGKNPKFLVAHVPIGYVIWAVISHPDDTAEKQP